MSSWCVFSHLRLHRQSESPMEKKNEIQHGNSQGLVLFTRNIYSRGVKNFVFFIYIN